jgi:hypothetical protein
MKYSVIYKCQLCGEIIRYGEAHEVEYNELPELCAKVVRNQMFASNQYLYQAPMQIPHQCNDGNCGMAYFLGFKHN